MMKAYLVPAIYCDSLRKQKSARLLDETLIAELKMLQGRRSPRVRSIDVVFIIDSVLVYTATFRAIRHLLLRCFCTLYYSGVSGN
jgi:hypothetical protein